MTSKDRLGLSWLLRAFGFIPELQAAGLIPAVSG
jgi:hypothetical protein